MSDPALLSTVAHYYAERLGRFGTTPQGVDWSSADSQMLRFERLLEVLEKNDGREATLNDVGCGYGALVDYLAAAGHRVAYRGFDISAPMIAAARARHAGVAWCSFTAERDELRPADYSVASGIFNVKLGCPVDRWREYALETLATMDSVSTRGFAFNMLSTYSDPPRRRDNLFYADPLEIFDICKRTFSPRVSLLHDYPLYEFTIIVRK